MSAKGWNGRALQIWLDGQKIAAVRSKTATHGRSPVDVTNDDSNADRTLLPTPAMRNVDLQLEGVATSRNYQDFLSRWNDDEFLDVEVRNPDGSIEEAEDGFFLGNVEFQGAYDGHVAFTAQLLSSGPVTINAS